MAEPCYIYTITVAGIVRYIGRGRANRLNHHVRNVNGRLAKVGRGESIKPHRFYDRLAAALGRGEPIAAIKVIEGLSGDEARLLEIEEIAKYPREQLWNSIYSYSPRALDAEVIARLSAASKRSNANPETKAKISAAIRRVNEDPEFLAKKARAISESWKNADVRARRSAGIKENKGREEHRQAVGAHFRSLWSSPQHRQRMVEKSHKAWQDPAYQAVMAKRQYAKGERHGQAKLSDAQVAEIRDLAARGGVSQRQIASQYGVLPSCVSRIVSGRRR